MQHRARPFPVSTPNAVKTLTVIQAITPKGCGACDGQLTFAKEGWHASRPGVCRALGITGMALSDGKESAQRRLLVLVAGQALALAVVLVIALLQHPHHVPSVLSELSSWVKISAAADSWMPMRVAYRWLSSDQQGTLYQNVFFTQHIKFQYPPSSMLLYSIPEALGIGPSDRFLNLVGWFAVLTQSIATGALFWLLTADDKWRAFHKLRLTGGILAGLVCLTYSPVLIAFGLGQIQAWLNALFTFSAILFYRGWLRSSGLVVGLICLVKPQFALFAVWAIVRRQWRFLRGLVGVLGVGTLVAVIWYGIANQFDYLSAISYMGRHGETFYGNASVNGLVNRWVGNGDSFHGIFHFPPFVPIVYAATLISSLFFVLPTFLGRQRTGFVDFLIAGLTFTIASPIAWSHHYGVVPVMLVTLAAMIALSRDGARAVILGAILFIAYCLSASYFTFPDWMGSGLASLPLSYLFFAELAVLVLLYALRASDATAPPVPAR
jgi:alpha-1,2-mannosyltransferase